MDNLSDKKLACLMLLEQYLKNNEVDKAIIVADMIKKLNREIENSTQEKRK